MLDPGQVRKALRTVVADLDYDLWKSIEMPEDGGEPEWDAVVEMFNEVYESKVKSS